MSKSTSLTIPGKRRFITVVYEIKDDAAWRDGGNPLLYEHHGLKSVCVSVGDLATLQEKIEERVREDDLDAKAYDALYAEHVISSLPIR